MSPITRRLIPAAITAGVLALTMSGCVQGESGGNSAPAEGSEWSTNTLSLDWATYNPLSLVVKDQGLIEDALGDTVKVEWIQSAGSNKANELLRSGSIDIGSTAGSAALFARANGSPIKVIDIFSQPEWAAIVVGADSNISDVADLKGTSVAATKGTDPYFFLLQTLEEAGLSASDVEIQNVQHADGRALLDGGSVAAWAGLDPIMAAAEVESGSRLIARNVDFNTYGFLNATEDFITDHADVAQVVVDAYEEARVWALAHPYETAQLLADAASIDIAVAETVINERSNLDVSGVPGKEQIEVLQRISPIIAESGDIKGGQATLDTAIASIVHDEFAKNAAQ
ncbi:aliphatic sulfonate ABC transporter substrate-binding protein [Leucobacter insecticola]|uniref:Putative aliphatic sulfonates-binding protein n=1 Tax=Leucobacter insecticola TaxID=2714934 RepID=A0A6G8FLX3_9MICO|nr:aliphatic sulfonate ABC transporter substrate-binding protein [Leucobacter insecticola]QIM17387.1 aliphatic sulfonate ABC transporter substrate-binding protein [Leucobacter insecticola]